MFQIDGQLLPQKCNCCGIEVTGRPIPMPDFKLPFVKFNYEPRNILKTTTWNHISLNIGPATLWMSADGNFYLTANDDSFRSCNIPPETIKAMAEKLLDYFSTNEGGRYKIEFGNLREIDEEIENWRRLI
jgi:hypothetical protein